MGSASEAAGTQALIEVLLLARHMEPSTSSPGLPPPTGPGP
ncbi:hypothetical protein [Actinacidiphila paucisporea]|nr:hypothetical protein [Actinacidiphila paucisporea]